MPEPRFHPQQRSVLREPSLFFSRPLRRAHRLFRSFPAGDYRTILDVGAHQGSFTDLAIPYFAPERLWLVEADPEYGSALKAKYSNNLAVTVIPCAISNVSGRVNLRINSHRDSSSILPMESISQKTFGIKMAETGIVEVTAWTLDELFEREKIAHVDLMKVDIQGAERLMIEGGAAALAKVDLLYIELSFERFYAGAPLAHEIEALLWERGFRLRSLHESRMGANGALGYTNALFLRPPAG
jgi:FkbM family methyltransferase